MKKYYFNRVPRAEVLAVEQGDLNDAFGQIEADWNSGLKNSGIKLPAAQTAKWYQLAVLKHFQGRAVHKDDIAGLIAQSMRKSATDQQVRHLKTQGGWYILNRGDTHRHKNVEFYNPEGCHVLITTEIPFPRSTLQRRMVVNKGDWKDILKQYGDRCASCGTKIGEYHRFDASFKVEVLERGHMNPNKPLVAGNIIPQCRWCNRTARGDFVFDSQGRPRAVASERPVARADPKVIDMIKKWLRGRGGG